MNSYENVINAIEFGTPERLPCQFGSMGVNDTHTVNWNQIGVIPQAKWQNASRYMAAAKILHQSISILPGFLAERKQFFTSL